MNNVGRAIPLRTILTTEKSKAFKYRLLIASVLLLLVCSLIILNFSTIRRALFGDIVFSHCVWTVYIEGWLDSNQNGEWDNDESAMSDIVYIFRFEDQSELSLTSDSEGKISHSFSIMCDSPQDRTVEIYPQVPSGMYQTAEPTTNILSFAVVPTAPLQFGFAFNDIMETLTP
jgi:hypothetical protein